MNGSSGRTTVISRTVARIVVPIILVTAIALLFRGHNLPGGGFIGAVLAAAAFALVYIIFGLEFIQREILAIKPDGSEQHRLVETYRWMASLGLAIAVASSLAPLAFGAPFLTQGVLFLEHLPLYGELEVASAFAFDLGVFFAVVGGLLTIVAEVGNE
ncbi:MnhB domain-containing protein [Haloferax denitrificans]|uniref:Multisubunit Na+/H+ antiporter, MnhA and MnhB subunits n=1 Tax=Haloferax denitrificans ATCC 35960 TaxID=662478 RepID=M0IW26_9EURY|nr:MnhB domain-containing protein [Haloferax denitrificans]EMA00263.1 Multisubunit Na+/H+ antiporter, MnhA and MnhB subunits [Haloferax denitrificans ATCC 35960]